MTIKRGCTGIHVVAILLLIANFILDSLSPFSINKYLEVSLEVLMISTGLILFVSYIKPFKPISIYFSVYAFWAGLVPFGYFLGGKFWSIVLIFCIYPIWPNGLEVEKDGLSIYENAHGFMTICCPYKVTQERYLIFEKELGEFSMIETIDPKTVVITESGHSVNLQFHARYSEESYSVEFELD